MVRSFKMIELTFLTLLCVTISNCEVIGRHHRSVLAKDIDELKIKHQDEIESLRSEMAQVRQEMILHCQPHHIRHASKVEEKNTKKSMEWNQEVINEFKGQIMEVAKKVNSSILLHQFHLLHNHVNRIEAENKYFVRLAHMLEARVHKMSSTVERLNYENKNQDIILGEVRVHLNSLSEQMKQKIVAQEEETSEITNNDVDMQLKESRKHSHNNSKYSQLVRISQAQDKMEVSHQSILVQLMGHQQRIEHLEKSNWEEFSAEIDSNEKQVKSLSERLNNNILKASDFDKMHASILELREDLEAVENKMDKTIPELRKEISKLDIDQAQMTAHFSYVKQDQETLRMSVKAIAVSMSNTQDRSASNLKEIKEIRTIVDGLTTQTKKHYHKLNDHIMKSEASVPVPETNLTEIISLPELMGEVKELQPVEREYQDLVAQLPKDCTNITGRPGSYIIRPAQQIIDAWCIEGTTLLQRRYNGSVNFNRKYAEYVQGFGEPSSEFWLGLESIHQITADNCSSMRIDMTDIYGTHWYAQYDSFFVDNSDTGYMLNVNGFRGNASDAFEYQNGMEFSAIDRDRDISNTHCAGNYEGGWWFSRCQHVNINGNYTLGLTWFDSTRNEWIAVATSEMRLFRRPGCF